MISGLLSGLLSGLIAGIYFDLHIGLLSGLIAGMFFTLLSALVGGPAIGLTHRLKKKIEPAFWGPERRYSAQNSILVGLVSGLLIGPISGLVFSLIGLLQDGLTSKLPHELLFMLRDMLIFALFFALPSALVSGLAIGLTQQGKKEVKPGEILGWLKGAIWRGLVKGETLKQIFVSMLVFGTLIWLLNGLPAASIGRKPSALSDGLIFGILFGLMSGLVFAFISGVVGGLSSDLIEKQTLTRPNQGIQRSAQNSILVGLVFGSLAGLIFGLLAGLSSGLSFGLIFGLLFALLSGLPIGLSNGGTAYIQHYILRMFLWRAGCTPWNYTRFLDYAAEHILLRKVGGSYIFVHRLLLDHFASFNALSLPSNTPSLPSQTQTTEASGYVTACVCGHPYHPTARFCTHCGKPKSETDAEQTQDIASRTTKPLQN